MTTTMTPALIGPPARPLFALWHEVPGATRAVLLCAPFGHEAIRSHRLHRVLADRLAADGIAVLRFDYHATGDSPGEDEEGDLAGWQQDVLAADAELRRRQPGADVTWCGARLGAALVLRAAAATPVPPRRLLLWDPVLDGRAYLDRLRAAHVAALELSYCIPEPAWRAPSSQPLTEAIGFAISPRLHAELQALVPDALPLPPGVSASVLGDPADAALARWLAGRQVAGRPVRSRPLGVAIDWTADPSPDSAMVPAVALQRLLAELQAVDTQGVSA